MEPEEPNNPDVPEEDLKIGQGSANKKRVKWTTEEDQRLTDYVHKFSGKNWKKIALAAFDNQKTDVQCLHRWQKVSFLVVI